MEYKKCQVCGNDFKRGYFVSKKQWSNAKCCSNKCHIKRITVLKTGKKRPDLVANRQGENNPVWKGDKLRYPSIHSWISRKFGKACKCEHCKQVDRKRYEWSNKDHQYKRELKDWQQLCVSCHKIYDRANNKSTA